MRKSSGSRRNGGIMQGVMKKVALLILVCFAIRLLSTLGAGDAFDSILQGIGKNSGLIENIIFFELGAVPHKAEMSDSKDQLHRLDMSRDDYPSESSLNSDPQSSPSPQGDTVSPSVTAVIAEDVVIPIPKTEQTDKQNDQMNIQVVNKTSYEIDFNAMLQEPLNISLTQYSPQILIVHTHGSEAYSETESSRSLDKSLNVIKVGEVFAAELRKMGLNVIHDTGIYDYPSYSGSYSRSLESVEKHLSEYPDIQIVFDIHRDSITLDDGSMYRPQYSIGEFTASQVMLIVATGEAGLDHPNWQENMKFGLRLQDSMESCYPGLARPMCISSERYNQHTVPGSILVEIGTDGNTIEEAMNAAKLFAASAGQVIKELTK